jgi:hypothetical protein
MERTAPVFNGDLRRGFATRERGGETEAGPGRGRRDPLPGSIGTRTGALNPGGAPGAVGGLAGRRTGGAAARQAGER